MGDLELTHISRMICLPLVETIITFLSVNTIQHPLILENNINHSNKRAQPPFFHSNTDLILGHVHVHSVDKNHVLGVTVELIWLLYLNILSFNFVQMPDKSLRFRRFKKKLCKPPCGRFNQSSSKFHCFFLLDVLCSK